MPQYTFLCPKHKSFEIFRTFSEYQEKEKCPSCKHLCSRNYQADQVNANIVVGDSDLKTIGHLANRNRDSLSNQAKMDLFIKHHEPNLKGCPEMGIPDKNPEKEFKKFEKRAERKAKDRQIKQKLKEQFKSNKTPKKKD